MSQTQYFTLFCAKFGNIIGICIGDGLSITNKYIFLVRFIQTKILDCHSMSTCLSYAVYNLKLLSSLGKTEASLRSFNLSLFYHQFLSFPISFFLFPKFSQRIDQLSLSLSLMRPRNSTKSALYLFATNEQVLDLEELDASKEDLESGVYQITM